MNRYINVKGGGLAFGEGGGQVEKERDHQQGRHCAHDSNFSRIVATFDDRAAYLQGHGLVGRLCLLRLGLGPSVLSRVVQLDFTAGSLLR